MRAKIAVIAVCLAILAAAVGGMAALGAVRASDGGASRVIQHEQAQQLADLSAEDREAASGTAIDAQSFASHLPVVSIETGGQEIPGDAMYDENGVKLRREDGQTLTTRAADGSADVTVDVKVFDSQGSANRLSDEPTLQTLSRIHYRGHSSLDYPKRNYSLHFVDESGANRNEEVMGMPADNGWILNGPYLDKSLIRNYLAYNVFGGFVENTPEVRFCELFVDGEYRGLFLFMEAVDVSPDRVPLTEASNASNKGAQTSYLLKLDRYDEEARTLSNLGAVTGLQDSPLTIEYPGPLELTEEQAEWIKDDFNAFEKALYSYDYDTEDYGYWNYLDVDSFVDYFIATEFSMNYDAGLYSTYLSRDIRGKISIGPLWDFNSAFDNYVESDYSEASGFAMTTRPWYTMLVKDEAFTDAVISRYRELREGPLSEERLRAFVEGTLDYLGPAIERNWEVWGSTFDPTTLKPEHRLIPLDRNPTSYEEAVDDLWDFIEKRGSWLDDNIENLSQYSHESAVKMDNH